MFECSRAKFLCNSFALLSRTVYSVPPSMFSSTTYLEDGAAYPGLHCRVDSILFGHVCVSCFVAVQDIICTQIHQNHHQTPPNPIFTSSVHFVIGVAQNTLKHYRNTIMWYNYIIQFKMWRLWVRFVYMTMVTFRY